MILKAFGIFLVAYVAGAEEKCCYDTAEVPPEVGCYNDDYPFDNMPLPNCPAEIEVSMRVFTRDNPNEGQIITRTTIPPVFDPSRRTHIIVHGWLGGRHSPWMRTHKDELLQQGDYNVIVTGWTGGSRQVWYPQSASDTKVTGTEIALTVKNLVDFGGARYEDMYCSGHSLGSHVCGHAGQRANYWGSFGRITGLDPAGPLFEGKDHPDIGLDATDALLVDVMHTHGEPKIILNLGSMKRMGHMDFYPNGGGLQPGCIFDTHELEALIGPVDPDTHADMLPFCSHLRVLQFYRESIQGCNYHSTLLCDDQYNLPQSCVSMGTDPIGSMGFQADQYDTHGIMYLETHSDKPFCLEWQ